MSRDPQINVRLPADLKEAVQKMAENNKRSVNAEIVAVLLSAVKQHFVGEPISGLKEIFLPSEVMNDKLYETLERQGDVLNEQSGIIQEQKKQLDELTKLLEKTIHMISEHNSKADLANKKPSE